MKYVLIKNLHSRWLTVLHSNTRLETNVYDWKSTAKIEPFFAFQLYHQLQSIRKKKRSYGELKTTRQINFSQNTENATSL